MIFHNIINKITSITKENKSFNNQGKLILLSITLLLPSIANVIFDYYKVERSKTNGQKRKTHQKNWYVAFQGKTILWLIGILSLMLTTHSKVKTCHINRVKKNMSNPTTCQQIKITIHRDPSQSSPSLCSSLWSFLSLNVDKQLEQRRLWAEELAIVDGQIQGLQMELRQQARWVGVNKLQGSVTDHIKGDQVVKGWWP